MFKYELVLRAGPGLDILVVGRARPGPHNSICGPGLYNCCGAGPGLGLKSYLRAGPGPRFQARAGPWCRDLDIDQTSAGQTRGRTDQNGKKYAQHHIQG